MTRGVLKRWAAAMLMAVSVVGHHGAAGAEEAKGLAAGTVLEEILAIMRQNGQITEEQRKALRERAEQEARQGKAERERAEKGSAGALTAGVENGRPFLQSASGDFRLELGGRFQLDYDAVEGKARTLAGTTLNNEFLVRRARIELKGSFFKWIDFLVECEFTRSDQKNGFCLNDAFMELKFRPELTLRVGQFKVPFSFEELSSDNTIDFVERSIINELAPSRDVGAVVRGSLFGGILGYDAGIFNGAASNGAATNTFDTSNGKDIAGRLTLAPFKPGGNYWLKGLQLAGSFTWGDGGGGATSNLSPQGRTGARTANRFVYFAQQPVRGDRSRAGTDLAWAVGPASFKFEYSEQDNERRRCGAPSTATACVGGQNLDDLTAAGWYVSGTWLVTGEDKPLTGPVIPKRPFNPIAGEIGRGAWELALRYAELSFSSNDPVDFLDGNLSNGITGGHASAENGVEALTAGVNWYLNSRVRAMLNWTHYWYDNALGTPFSCSEGRSSCSATQLRRLDDPTSWEILSRVQMWF